MNKFVYFVVGGALGSALVFFWFISQATSLTAVHRSHHTHKNWLISFADGAVHQSNQNFLNTGAINKGFDCIITYGKSDIDPKYYAQHKEILSQKRGAGYWLWKPYLMQKTLNIMSEGDILFYIDTGNAFLVNADFFIDELDKNDADIMLFRSYHKNRRYTKIDAYSLMQVDEKYRDYPQIGATVIIARKSKRSMRFIKKWREYCENPQLLTDTASIKVERDDFIDHRHDQSILSLLYYKDPEKILVLDYHGDKMCDKFFHHRRRDISTSLELLYYPYLSMEGLCDKTFFKERTPTE